MCPREETDHDSRSLLGIAETNPTVEALYAAYRAKVIFLENHAHTLKSRPPTAISSQLLDRVREQYDAIDKAFSHLMEGLNPRLILGISGDTPPSVIVNTLTKGLPEKFLSKHPIPEETEHNDNLFNAERHAAIALRAAAQSASQRLLAEVQALETSPASQEAIAAHLAAIAAHKNTPRPPQTSRSSTLSVTTTTTSLPKPSAPQRAPSPPPQAEPEPPPQFTTNAPSTARKSLFTRASSLSSARGPLTLRSPSPPASYTEGRESATSSPLSSRSQSPTLPDTYPLSPPPAATEDYASKRKAALEAHTQRAENASARGKTSTHRATKTSPDKAPPIAAHDTDEAKLLAEIAKIDTQLAGRADRPSATPPRRNPPPRPDIVPPLRLPGNKPQERIVGTTTKAKPPTAPTAKPTRNRPRGA